jgi:hypothetical protein
MDSRWTGSSQLTSPVAGERNPQRAVVVTDEYFDDEQIEMQQGRRWEACII